MRRFEKQNPPTKKEMKTLECESLWDGGGEDRVACESAKVAMNGDEI